MVLAPSDTMVSSAGTPSVWSEPSVLPSPESVMMPGVGTASVQVLRTMPVKVTLIAQAGVGARRTSR
jgi:hypothetical protein